MNPNPADEEVYGGEEEEVQDEFEIDIDSPIYEEYHAILEVLLPLSGKDVVTQEEANVLNKRAEALERKIKTIPSNRNNFFDAPLIFYNYQYRLIKSLIELNG